MIQKGKIKIWTVRLSRLQYYMANKVEGQREAYLSLLFLLTLALSGVSCPIYLVCSRRLVAASNHRSLQLKSLIALKVTNASVHIVARHWPQPSIGRRKKNRTSKNWMRKHCYWFEQGARYFERYVKCWWYYNEKYLCRRTSGSSEGGPLNVRDGSGERIWVTCVPWEGGFQHWL